MRRRNVQRSSKQQCAGSRSRLQQHHGGISGPHPSGPGGLRRHPVHGNLPQAGSALSSEPRPHCAVAEAGPAHPQVGRVSADCRKGLSLCAARQVPLLPKDGGDGQRLPQAGGNVCVPDQPPARLRVGSPGKKNEADGRQHEEQQPTHPPQPPPQLCQPRLQRILQPGGSLQRMESLPGDLRRVSLEQRRPAAIDPEVRAASPAIPGLWRQPD